MSQYFLLKSRTYLLVKNFPESDNGSLIQMSFISTDLEVKGITEQLFAFSPICYKRANDSGKSTAV